LCESATRKGSGRIQRSYDTRGKTGSKIAAFSGKNSKDNNSNSKRKSAKEIAAFEGSVEVYLEVIICKFPLCYTHIANKSSREKKKGKGDSELNALNAQNFQVNISNRNFAICSGKDSKDGNSNRRGKNTKLNAAFKG